MVSRATLVFVGLAVAGVALIGWAVGTGSARFYLILIVPVVAGASLPLLVGVLLLFVGILGYFATGGPWPVLDEADPESATEGASTGGSGTQRSGVGGFVLIGPFPLFFGSARPADRRTYALAVLAGIGLFLAFVWIVTVLLY